MRVNRGRLQTPIAILRATSIQDDAGDIISEVTDHTQVFCEWLPIAANAVTQAKAEGMTLTAKLHIDLSTNITHTDKVKNLVDGQVYDVVSVMPVPADNKTIVICGLSNE